MNELDKSLECVENGIKINKDDENLNELKIKIEKAIKKEKKMKEIKELLLKRK